MTPSFKRWFAAGAAIALAGFGVLTQSDPAGRNWASTLSPFLLIAGYGLMGYAFSLLRDS